MLRKTMWRESCVADGTPELNIVFYQRTAPAEVGAFLLWGMD
jgi:hypothetical protein